MTASPLPVLPADSYARLAEHARVRTHLVVVAEHLAAALLAHRAGGHLVVSSAGAQVAADVEPVVAQALTGAGVRMDLTDAFPGPLTDVVGADRGHRHHHGMRGRVSGRARPALPGPARQ